MPSNERKGIHQIVPISFLPSVLKRQQEAVWDLCKGDDRFTMVVQDLVFSRPEYLIPAVDLHSQETGMQGIANKFNKNATAMAAMSTDQREIWSQANMLNAQQHAAVQAAVGSNLITLIEGPPGTGKTMVAAAIVEAWLKQDPKLPILVATGTHATKNLLADRLQKRNLQLSDRRDFIFKQKPRKIVSPVFVETAYMAAVPADRTLPRVLIDESTQITEATALVALGRGCCKLVLIGDPKQLGPVSILDHFNLTYSTGREQYSEERHSFYELMQLRHGLEPVHLNVQYRMDPRLCSYPSKRFYNGALVDADTISAPQQYWSNFRMPEVFCRNGEIHPTIFIDTTQLENRREEHVPFCGAVSLQNNLEATVVLQLLILFAQAGVSKNDFSILTSYGAQRDLLAKSIHETAAVLKSQRWQQRASKLMCQGIDPTKTEPHPHVHTIDDFQGCENDFVVFSAVRSNAEGRTGFVGNPRRVCVLLTRARRFLIIIGDSSTLQHDDEWDAWLKDAPKQTLSALDFLDDSMPPSAIKALA